MVGFSCFRHVDVSRQLHNHKVLCVSANSFCAPRCIFDALGHALGEFSPALRFRAHFDMHFEPRFVSASATVNLALFTAGTIFLSAAISRAFSRSAASAHCLLGDVVEHFLPAPADRVGVSQCVRADCLMGNSALLWTLVPVLARRLFGVVRAGASLGLDLDQVVANSFWYRPEAYLADWTQWPP